MTNTVFIAFDGDNIGSRIEYLVIMNDIEKLSAFSRMYEDATQWLTEVFKQQFNATCVFMGGDNALLYAETSRVSLDIIHASRAEFHQRTGQTLSIGLGFSPREAYFALKLAKASGKNTVRHYDELLK